VHGDAPVYLDGGVVPCRDYLARGRLGGDVEFGGDVVRDLGGEEHHYFFFEGDAVFI